MSVLNHKEALELAHLKKEDSNLSRCYIDLTEQLSEREKQNVLLRDWILQNCQHSDNCDVLWQDDDEFQMPCSCGLSEALDTTQDLSCYILCDAEPFAVMNKTILYKARKP
jgi:hypothetical protein